MFKFRYIAPILVFILFSCQNKIKEKYTDTYTTGTIYIAVDESLQPIIQEEIDVFEAMSPKAKIQPIFTNEVNAINLLLKDSVRVAITTRALSSKEDNFLKSKKFYAHSYKLATDGIALIINKHNRDSILNVNDIKKILTGESLNWKDIFPASNLGKFQVVFDNQNSSTVRFVLDSICGGKTLSKNVYAQNSNLEVIDYVSRTPNAIGFIGVNWLGNRKDTTNLTFKEEIRVMSVSAEPEATRTNSYKPFQAYFFTDIIHLPEVYMSFSMTQEGHYLLVLLRF